MVRPLLADPPGWHHITGAGALHLAARFCTAFCTMQSASLLHSADTTTRLHRTFHLDGPEQHESRGFPADAVPFWHLYFWATVFDLFYWVAARLIVLPRTLFPVLTGSCMARCPLQCLQAQAQAPCRLVSFVCFVRLASRSTSQPSRNPRGPVTRVWDRPMYTLAPQKRPMGLSVGACLYHSCPLPS